jgi:hypothetical protein
MPVSAVEESGFALDERQWPLVIARFSPALTDRELDRFLELQLQLLERGSRYLVLVDMSATVKSALTDTTAKLKELAQWTKKNEEALLRLNMGTGCVIKSILLRSFFATVLWMRPASVPTAAFANVELAMQWLQKRAAATKLALKK